MPFRDLDEFLVVPTFDLPIRGKTYRFPGTISAKAGLMLQRLELTAARAKGVEDAQKQALDELDPEQPIDLNHEVMGDVRAEMVADGLSQAHVQHTFMTLLIWHLHGQDAAERVWERKQPGEAPAPSRAARRASSGTGKSTRTPASTSGTRTRTAPSKRARPATRGATS
jgi:hypothetical protein